MSKPLTPFRMETEEMEIRQRMIYPDMMNNLLPVTERSQGQIERELIWRKRVTTSSHPLTIDEPEMPPDDFFCIYTMPSEP